MHHDHNVVIQGCGPTTLLFVHGYGCDQDMWRLVTPVLMPGRRVVTYDQAGCGRRGLVPYDAVRHAHLEGYANDLIELVTRTQIGPVVMVGHSVSAMIGVLAYRRAPHLFRGFAMIGPSPCYLNDGDYPGGFSVSDIEGLLQSLDANHRSWSSMMAQVIMANLDRPALAEELAESFCRMDPIAARGFARATFFSDNRADLRHVRIPTLIMQCTDDPIANLQVGSYVNRNISGSTLVQLAATGHCPNLSAPDEVAAVLQPWLHSIDA